MLSSVFGRVSVGQSLVHMTRVGLVTYSSNATVIANIGQFRNNSDLIAGLFNIQVANDQRVFIFE